MAVVVPPGFDLTDPDILADRLPLDEFAYLREKAPVFWNAQDPAASGHDDGGFWALTRHADVGRCPPPARAGPSSRTRPSSGSSIRPTRLARPPRSSCSAWTAPPHPGPGRRHPVLHPAGRRQARRRSA
jgi:hypothetical protein